MTVACFDVGGTGVKFAKIDQNLSLKDKAESATPKSLEELMAFMSQCLEQKDFTAISISFPGAIDKKTGIIMGISAVPYIHGPSWYKLLASYKVPIFMENDANCVGLSQMAISKDIQNFICVVCGTGIGGALIINRHLIAGPKAYAGEFGCMIIDRQEKPMQNWSQLASTASLVRRVEATSERNLDWNGRLIFEEAAKGDQVCQKAIDRMVNNMAIGMMNLYYFCDPEKIFLGGGISQNEAFIHLLEEKLTDLANTYDGFPVVPAIEACHYHQDANLIGAYMNTFQ